MKKILVVLIMVWIVILSAEPWSKSADVNLTATQNAYSNNWAGTELGLISWVFNASALAEKQLSAKISNKNTLKLSFGQTINQVEETDTLNNTSKKWSSPVKSTDLVDFESMLRFTLGILVDPFVAGRIESQFLDNSDTINRIFNPAKFTESFGIARTLAKQDKLEWNARLGAGLRQNYNRLVGGGSETTNDGGLEFITDFKTPLAQERITYTSNLKLFQAFFRSGSPAGSEWKAPDINWENIFTGSITKYLMVNLYTQLLYDKEIDTDLRIKETIALGLTYKFI